jgi:hypothetical protein
LNKTGKGMKRKQLFLQHALGMVIFYDYLNDKIEISRKLVFTV